MHCTWPCNNNISSWRWAWVGSLPGREGGRDAPLGLGKIGTKGRVDLRYNGIPHESACLMASIHIMYWCRLINPIRLGV